MLRPARIDAAVSEIERSQATHCPLQPVARNVQLHTLHESLLVNAVSSRGVEPRHSARFVILRSELAQDHAEHVHARGRLEAVGTVDQRVALHREAEDQLLHLQRESYRVAEELVAAPALRLVEVLGAELEHAGVRGGHRRG
eukprot:6207947-Pleurochrysis_carterae.AAC.4